MVQDLWTAGYCIELFQQLRAVQVCPDKLIPLTILNALDGKSLSVYGTGSNVRDWLHVDDHARGLIMLLERGEPGEKYNFGGDSERTNLSVVELICDILDRLSPVKRPRRSLISFVPDRPGHDLRYAIDASKARQHLGWRPQIIRERSRTHHPVVPPKYNLVAANS